MVSAWTGSKQSFLDDEKTFPDATRPGQVSRADLLRCRANFHLQDTASIALAWRPWGYMAKQDVEPELWPCLESKCSRQYHSFTWYHPNKSYPATFGFRREEKRDIKQVPDNLACRRSGEQCQSACQHEVKLAPSKKSTLRMLSFLVGDAVGGRHSDNAAFPNFLQHRWLRGWEGIMSFDAPSLPTLDVDVAVKEPSWFLRRWIKGDNDARFQTYVGNSET